MARKITKLEALRELYNDGNDDHAFIANVVSQRCSKPAVKLVAIVKLIRAGREVRTLDFEMPYNGIRVDGSARSLDQVVELARGL